MELKPGKTYNYDPNSGTFTRDKGRSLDQQKGYTKDQKNFMRTEKPWPQVAKKSSKKRNYG